MRSSVVLVVACVVSACGGPPPPPYFSFAEPGVDSGSELFIDANRQIWTHTFVAPTHVNSWTQTGQATQSEVDAIQSAVESLPTAPGPACTNTNRAASLVWAQKSGSQTWNVCRDNSGGALAPYDTVVGLIQSAGH